MSDSKLNFRALIIPALLIFFFGCGSEDSSNGNKRWFSHEHPDLHGKIHFQYDFHAPDSRQIKEDLRLFSSLLRSQKGNNEEAIEEAYDRLLDDYISLQRNSEIFKSSSKVQIPPHSKVRFILSSFCLDVDEHSPSENEYFHFKRGIPDIPLYKEIMDYYRVHQEIEKENVQDLIWSLNARIPFNYLEDFQQDLLLKIDPQARMKLGNFQIGVGPRGQSNSRSGRNRSPRVVQTRTIPLDETNLQSLEGSSLAAETKSNSYSNQRVNVYNPTDENQTLDISEYYLEPESDDVQPIGLAVAPTVEEEEFDALKDALETALYMDGAEWLLSKIPIVSTGVALAEFLTGKQTTSGQPTGIKERLVNGLSVALGDKRIFRWLRAKAFVPRKYLNKLHKGFEGYENYKDLRNALELPDETQKQMIEAIAEKVVELKHLDPEDAESVKQILSNPETTTQQKKEQIEILDPHFFKDPIE